jgi:hypothetical protein
MPTKGWDTSDPTDPAPLPELAVEKARASPGAPQENEWWLRPLHMILSSIVALFNFVGYLLIGGAPALFTIGAFVLVPLTCIWLGKGLIRELGWLGLILGFGYLLVRL